MDKPNNVHGSAVVIGTTGLLIRGKSGSGKSSTARLLVEHHLQIDEYACWVSDDQVLLVAHKNAIIANAPDAITGQAERRFCGLEHVPHVAAARLDLVVDLIPIEDLERLPERETVQLMDASSSLPKINAPAIDSALATDVILGFLRERSDEKS